MAQIIKHRRGSLEGLSAVTASVQKGELLIATGSSNLTTVNGTSLVFAANSDGQIQAVNRFLQGTSAPNTFSNAAYNGLVNGVPYYDSGSGTLYLLGTDGNTAINLVGNIQPFSASVASSINALSASIGSGTIGTSVTLLNSFTASQLTQNSALATYTGSVNTKFTEVGVVTGSLILSASADRVSITNLNLSSASQQVSIDNLNTFSSSVNTRLTEVGVVTGSLISSASLSAISNTNQNTFTASAETRFTQIGVVSGSLISSASAASVSISNINAFTQSFSQSVATSFSASAASVTSLSSSVTTTINTLSSSVATSFSASAASQTALSASVATTFANVASTNTAQDTRLNTLSSFTASYATTGSNTFFGNQIVTGSVFITANLIVQGSSSLQNITASAVSIGTNIVKLNTDAPAVRFGGISVFDSGSSGTTGSLFWDSLNNVWLYQNPSGSGYTSAKLISGPQNSGSLGSEGGLTTGRIVLAVGDDHISDSIITQATNNSKVTINGGLDVTGSISGSITGIGNVTAYSTSVDSRLVAVETSLGGGGSIGSRVAALETSSANVNAFTASENTKSSTLATVTASYDSRFTTLGTYTGSVETRFSTLATYTGSVNASLTALNTSSASQQVSIDNLNTTSASVNVSISNLNSTTASLNTSVSNINSFTSSASGRLSNLETTSASVNTSISNINTYTASVSTSVSNINAFTSSANTRFTEIGVVTGSLITSASLAAISNANQNTFTASANTRLGLIETSTGSLNTFTASQLTQNSTLATYTGSVETRLTQIGVVSGSLISTASANTISITNINTTTASLNTSVSNINTFTASFGTTFSASVDSRLDVLEANVGQAVNTNSDVSFAKITTSGNAIIGGDLIVQGNTVTLNVAQLVVEDKLITLASGSVTSSTSDGSGFEVAGTSANFVYQHSSTSFTSSVALVAPAVTASVNLGTAAGNSKRIAFRNTNGNLDLVPTASVADAILQWNGTDFVMSNVIDGGSF